jgi:hypothetical protein
MTETISEKLDRMAEFQAQKDLLAIDKQTLIDQVLTTEVKARLAEIETEFDGRAEAVDANIAALEAEIKEDVLKHGATVRGAYMMAVWNKGRVAWDDRRSAITRAPILKCSNSAGKASLLSASVKPDPARP